MALWSKRDPNNRCVVLVDIGSGSVGIAICVSNLTQAYPTIVWSHREFALNRDHESSGEMIKQINTTLINAFLELGSAGLKALKEYNPRLSITHVQATIAAPWSYTVNKTVSFTDENPFPIDSDLIEELAATAEKQAEQSVEQAGLSTGGLSLIANATIQVSINGYAINHISNQTGRTVHLSHITAIADESIQKSLHDSVSKVLPRASIKSYSTIYLFYCMLKHMHPNTNEICLIDVTNEATEIGIVREGILEHVTNAPYGTFTLAREIALACGVPKEEAYTYLKGGKSFVDTKLSKAKQEQLDAIVSTYELKLASLFKSTGDTLTIPKTIFLHCSNATETFFATHIKNAAKQATSGAHSVHLITSKLLEHIDAQDTPIVMAAQFYHQDLHCDMPDLF